MNKQTTYSRTNKNTSFLRRM